MIGTSGSGKTTLAKDLSRLLGCLWLELDSVYHQAGWTPLEAGEFRRRVSEAAAVRRFLLDAASASASGVD